MTGFLCLGLILVTVLTWFLRKRLEDGAYKVSAISASDVLKRNTDSVRNAVENDVFASLPQDSLLDELEMGWADEQ